MLHIHHCTFADILMIVVPYQEKTFRSEHCSIISALWVYQSLPQGKEYFLRKGKNTFVLEKRIMKNNLFLLCPFVPSIRYRASNNQNAFHKQHELAKDGNASAKHYITADMPTNLHISFHAIQISYVPVPCASLLAGVGVKNNQKGSK